MNLQNATPPRVNAKVSTSAGRDGEQPAPGGAPPQDWGSARVGIVLGLLAPLLWSTGGMFIKIVSVPPLPLTGLRAAIAALTFLPLVRSFPKRPDFQFLALMGAYAGMCLSFVTATKWTTAANAIALQATAPAWVFAFSSLLARKVEWRYFPPIAIILAGLAAMLLEPVTGQGFAGNLVASLSGFLFALTTVLFSRVRRPLGETIFSINLATAALLFLIDPGAYRLSAIPLSEWLALGYLGAVQIGISTMLFYAALRRIPPTQGTVLALLEPLLNPIWVFLAIGEIPSFFGLAGGGLILTGILADAWLRWPTTKKAD